MSGDPRVDLIRRLFNYNPDDGTLTWAARPPRSRIQIGTVAGTSASRGYLVVTVGGRQLKAHRVAWAHYHGEWPTTGIDHINGATGDNRINNLRLATPAQNRQNIHRPTVRSKSGAIGVVLKRSKWQAAIKRDGSCIHLGSFDTKEQAGAAYLAAKATVHPFWVAQ